MLGRLCVFGESLAPVIAFSSSTGALERVVFQGYANRSLEGGEQHSLVINSNTSEFPQLNCCVTSVADNIVLVVLYVNNTLRFLDSKSVLFGTSPAS